jgi:hypothetical protein
MDHGSRIKVARRYSALKRRGYRGIGQQCFRLFDPRHLFRHARLGDLQIRTGPLDLYCGGR